MMLLLATVAFLSARIVVVNVLICLHSLSSPALLLPREVFAHFSQLIVFARLFVVLYICPYVTSIPFVYCLSVRMSTAVRLFLSACASL